MSTQSLDELRGWVGAIVKITWGCFCSVPEGQSYVAIDLSPLGIPPQKGEQIFQEAGLEASLCDQGIRLSCDHGTDPEAWKDKLRFRAEKKIMDE